MHITIRSASFFEHLKRDSILPELFLSDPRQRSSERKVQAAPPSRDRVAMFEQMDQVCEIASGCT
jgi:hypothetical protein